MADGGSASRSSRGRAGDDGRGGDEDLGPLLELAREIKREVDRIAADDRADIDEVSTVIDRFGREERERVAQAVFGRLPVEAQWAVLERVFGDAEIRTYLADEHDRRQARISRSGARLAVAEEARDTHRLVTTEVADGDQVTIGLFREPEVRAALARGHRSDACARSLVLRRAGEDGFRVVEDVFNPRGGFFVTRDYDAAAWVVDRFESHQTIEVGAAADGPHGATFEAVIYPGSRLDFRHDGAIVRGHLHVGFVMLDDIDVFAGQG